MVLKDDNPILFCICWYELWCYEWQQQSLILYITEKPKCNETVSVWLLLVVSITETAVDRQISFPLSHVLHANGERNGQPLLHDFTEDIQFMDIEETSGEELNLFSLH